jgi:hypothetical protein
MISGLPMVVMDGLAKMGDAGSGSGMTEQVMKLGKSHRGP